VTKVLKALVIILLIFFCAFWLGYPGRAIYVYRFEFAVAHSEFGEAYKTATSIR
jgi:hypothetical protein